MQSSSKANVDHPADVVTSEDVPWRVQLAVYAAGMFSHSLNGMAMVVLPLWVVSLESTPLLVGVALGSRFALLALLSIHTGSLMDRLGTRRVMLIFGISGGLLHLLYPALPSIGALIVLQAFAGLTGSMGWIGSQALVGQLMRGNATCAGRLSFSLRIGAFLGPPLVGLTWDYVGPWGAFPMLSGWAFCSVIAAALVPVDRDKSPGPVRVADLVPRPSDYTQAFRLFLVPAIALVVAVTVVRHTAVSIQHSFYVVWLDQLGISGTEIGVLTAAWSVLGSVSALSVGRLVRLCADYWLVVLAVAAQIVLISITPILPNYLMLLGAMALYGGSMGISQPLMISLMARSTSKGAHGKSAGLRTTANQLAATAVPPLMGGVADLVGLQASFYLIGGVLILLMILISLAIARSTTFT